jgi:hypothetical protein
MSKKKEKVIVTNFSTKKWDLEHYGLSDVCIVFFKSKMEKSKMDIYKCPFSKNPKYFWKKRFTSFTSASALPIFATLPLCFDRGAYEVVTWRPLCCGC